MGYIKNIFIYTDNDDSSDEAEASQPKFSNECLVENFDEEVEDEAAPPSSLEDDNNEGSEKEEDVEVQFKEEEEEKKEKQHLTAKGTERVRNNQWTNEEHYALFCSLFKLEDKIRATGPGTAEAKHEAWDTVIGED